MLKQEIIEKTEAYRCSICSAIFSDVQLFVEHVTTGHGQQTKVFANPENLLKCPSCPLSFDRTQHLKDHMENIHQSVPTFSIEAQPINDSESISPNSTSKSSATIDETSSSSSFYNDGLFCSQCKKPFANKYSLMKHLRSTKCKLESEASINRVINDQLTCNKCKHQFGSVQALKKHVDGKKCMVHSNQSSNQIFRAGLVFDESIQLTPYATVSVFKCPDPLCAKPCVTLRAFRMHAKCVHDTHLDPILEEAKANYICKVRGCGKLFVEEQQLDVHFKHHENYTPRIGKHKCIICGEAFYQKDMLKRHVLSFHNEVTSFRGRSIISKNSISKSQSQQQISSTKSSNKAGYKRTMECPNLLKYNSNVTLSPGTLMTVFKCPVEGCNKKSCTDIKSFKLHCMHIHQDKSLEPIGGMIGVQEEAKYICQVENCGKLYMEKKQYEIHLRHHKTYVPSTGRYFKCQQCDSKFNSQANLDVHTIQLHMNSEEPSDESQNPNQQVKNDLIFEDITLEPGTLMTVFHCPIETCPKKNYLDAKSVKTHCRRIHSMIDHEAIPSQTEAQYICQVRGCRKLFVEAVQIEAHLKHHRNYIPTNGNFECKCCPETFTRKEQLDQHILANHTYDGLIKSQQKPVHHVKHSVHGSHLSQDSRKKKIVAPVPTQSQPSKVIGYQCSICLRKFLHLGTHCNHATNAHQIPGLQPVEVEMKPRYTCKQPRCGKHFMTKNMYKIHTDRHQGNNGTKKSLHCSKCQRVFSQFKSLYQHLIQTHEDVTSEEIAELEAAHAKCSVCRSVFRNEEILKNHMKRHVENNIIMKESDLSSSSSSRSKAIGKSKELMEMYPSLHPTKQEPEASVVAI